jgi:hypothetical protein
MLECMGSSRLLVTLRKAARADTARGPSFLGKLGFKPEPGKVRVFAMVDYWTQCCLGPLHEKLFEILRTISTDGTHDQEAPIRGLLERMKSEGRKEVFSYDLSSATDRIPLGIQVILLNTLFPNTAFGTFWGNLLSTRIFSYELPDEVKSKPGEPRKGMVRYATGQPMGALSSWAMLALTHHMLVQTAALRAGILGWFEWYAVLGDDVVIADRAVARQYLRLMAELGVEVGLAKSLVSYNGSLEFAKRFFVSYEDATPLSMKEFDVARNSLSGLLIFMSRASKLAKLRLASVLAGLGRGYRVRAQISNLYSSMRPSLAKLLTILTMPGSAVSTKADLGSWLGSLSVYRSIVLPDDRVLQSIVDGLLKPLAAKVHDLQVKLYEGSFDSALSRAYAPLFHRRDAGVKDALLRIIKELLEDDYDRYEETVVDRFSE